MFRILPTYDGQIISGGNEMVMPKETILLGGERTCPDCGVTPEIGVYHSPAGYYVGTYCNCGPYSRESGYYKTQSLALAALQNGDYGR